MTLPADDGFDRTALERLVRFGGVKLLRGMVDIFAESAPSRVDDFRSGLAGGDRVTLQRTFHSLKSSAAQLGAVRLSEMSREGEALLAGGAAPSEAERLVRAVESELDDAVRWMQRTRATLEDRGR
jgi:HPt (histidine-containing phosphotransfer) domain-containing protein